MLVYVSAAVVTCILVWTVTAEHFIGRHVCNHKQTMADPVPIQQTYIRAVYRKNATRPIYQTAYRTIFKMQIRYENVTGCCPGWAKRSDRDTDCMKPLCEEECENGGTCAGPDLCICREGYAGYTCSMDIDECTGRNTCQQKCTNLPGSYQCSCQEGFRLASDDYTCDLCLSCTEEFKSLYAQLEMYQNKSSEGDYFEQVQQQMENLTFVITQNEIIRAIQDQIYNLTDSTIQLDRFHELESQVDILKVMIKEVDIIKDLDSRIGVLEESDQSEDKIQDMQIQINELSKIKDLVDSVQVLNNTVLSIQQDGSQAAKIDEMQKQIEELEIIKAQQDEAQQIRFEEMSKNLERLQEVNSLSEAVQGVKTLVAKVTDRVQNLESDKLEALDQMAKHADRFQYLQSQIDSLHGNLKQFDIIKELTTKLNKLEETSQHTDKFHAIQDQIDELAVTKSLVTEITTLNNTVQSLLHTDNDAAQFDELQRQMDDVIVNAAQQEKSNSDRFEEMQNDIQQLRQITVLSTAVADMKEAMTHMSKRIEELESSKVTLQNTLAEVMTQYGEAISSMQVKEVVTEHTAIDHDDVEPAVPLDRLASLSAQISILEEKMADCNCEQDYRHG